MSDPTPETETPETPETLTGRDGLLDTPGGLKMRVRILEAKLTYGRLRVRVAPLSGEGDAWVYRSRVVLDPTS